VLLIGCLVSVALTANAQAAKGSRALAASPLSPDPSPGFQIDAAHTGYQASDPLTPPLAQRWSVDLGGPVSYPVIAGGLVFATAGYSGGRGARLYALDQGTGQSVWGPIDLGGGGRVSGLVYEGGRIVAVNEMGSMQAFDAGSGARLWVKQITAYQETVRSAPVAVDGIIYLGGGQWTLYAIRASDGTTLWHQGTNGAEYSGAAVAGGVVYQVYDCQEAEAFDAASGSIVWHNPTTCSGPRASTPVVAGGRVYARESNTGGPILDALTGATVGQFSAGPAPAFDGSKGYFLFDKALHAQAIGGTVDSWKFDGDGSLNTAAIIVNSYVYVGSTSGNVYAINATTGAQAWSANAGAPVSYNDANIGTAPAPPFAGLGAGEGVLVVPATTRLVEYSSGGGPLPPTTPPVAYPSPTFPAPLPGADAAVSFQIDPQHSGRQPNDSLAPPLSQLWTRTVDGNVSYPLIVDGRVFVTDLAFGTGPAPPTLRHIYGMDERTGKDLWPPLLIGRTDFTGAAHLAYDGGRLFALSNDGLLEAIDPQTGAVLWSRPFSEPNGAQFDAAPVAMNGLIYFSDSACSGSFFAVRESDGATVWRQNNHCYPIAMPASLTDDGSYWTHGTCGIWDFDPLNGNLLWQRFCGSDYSGFSPIYAGRIYVEEQNAGNRSFDRETGQPAVTGFSSEKPPTFDGGLGFYLTGSTLMGEELSSNRIVWTFTGDGQLITAPILVNGYVYVGSKTGNLFAVEEATGRQAWAANAGAAMTYMSDWQTSTRDQPMTGLAAADGLLVAPASNRLVAFTPGSFIDTATFHSAASTRQYHLTNSDGRTWSAIDPSALAVTVKPGAPATAVLGGNADLWTATAGVNQDLGLFVSVNGATDQLLAWKESGGFAGTFSPNAAYVQGVFDMQPGNTYRFLLKWKANKATPGSIYAGAGPIEGRYSPTRLTVRVDATPATTLTGTGQYRLQGSDGSAWLPLDPSLPSLRLTPTTRGTVLLQANADLWTQDAGYNQDLGIFASSNGGAEQLVAWKESGGFAGTFSPNAAYVQGLLRVTAGEIYTVRLKWKANRGSPAATIVAGAGPIDGAYSPTRLTARMVGTTATQAAEQFSLTGSNGRDWHDLGPGAPVVNLAPTSDGIALLGGNADLWTAAAGVNQDLGIFVSINGGAPQLLAWKESGGFSGTFSPNAAFTEVAIPVAAGETYRFSLRWKANRMAGGATIYAGAGPIDGGHSTTSLSLEVFSLQ
jgi:outer membrane protein assembly factor BamB